MPGMLWWLQVVGGLFSVILMAGAILAGLYTTVRDMPIFLRRLTGKLEIERRLERLHTDHKLVQQLQLQQAEAFNDLKNTVCDEHEIPDDERPPGMDISRIRSDVLGRDITDFTRGNFEQSSDESIDPSRRD